jgi:hypothetical protein
MQTLSALLRSDRQKEERERKYLAVLQKGEGGAGRAENLIAWDRCFEAKEEQSPAEPMTAAYINRRIECNRTPRRRDIPPKNAGGGKE